MYVRWILFYENSIDRNKKSFNLMSEALYSIDNDFTNFENIFHITCPRFVFLRHKYAPKNKPITEKIVTVAMIPDMVVLPVPVFNFVP